MEAVNKSTQKQAKLICDYFYYHKLFNTKYKETLQKHKEKGFGGDQKRKPSLKRNQTFLLLKKIIEESCEVLFLASSISPIPHA